MKIKILFLTFLSFSLANNVFAAECLSQLADQFAKSPAIISDETSNQFIQIDYNSSESNFLVVSNAGNKQCKVSYSQFARYLTNYKKDTAISPNLSYQIGWNSWYINNQKIYDLYKDLNPLNLNKDNDPGDVLKESIQVHYTPISILNNSYACYRNSFFIFVSGAAHPVAETFLACNLIGKPKADFTDDSINDSLKIKDVFYEPQLVQKLLATPYLRSALINAKVKPSSIHSFSELQAKLGNKIDSDPILSCTLSGIDDNYTRFAITKLNSDKTVNILFGLTPNYGAACNFVYKEFNLNNLKTKMAISSVNVINN